MEKTMRGKIIKLYEEDEDILEDAITENRQAIEMANIYRDILNGTMDAYASIISNNLNDVMKALTVLTIVMEIPNMVFSYYGMNVTGLPFPVAYFPIIVAFVICAVAAFIFKKKDMF